MFHIVFKYAMAMAIWSNPTSLVVSWCTAQICQCLRHRTMPSIINSSSRPLPSCISSHLSPQLGPRIKMSSPTCTWTIFEFPASEPLDISTFEPLITRKRNYRRFYHGRIAESTAQCVLMVVWHTPKAYDAFKRSAEYHELVANLTKNNSASEPTTHIINFQTSMPWKNLGAPRNEVRTVYFPASTSLETRQEVTSVKGLVSSVNWGIGGNMNYMYPHQGTPDYGWVEGTQLYNGKESMACVWVNHWRSEEAEVKFKTTERRWPEKGGPDPPPLAVEDFEQRLKALGAIGWQEYHVTFERVSGSGHSVMSED